MPDSNNPEDVKRIAIGTAIKAIGKNRVGGYLVYWGDSPTKDLQGEWFSGDTDFLLNDYPVVGEPNLFQHGLDIKIGVQTVGKFVEARKDDWGLWAEAILDERKEYTEYVMKLVEDGVLDWSSGALPQGVIVDDSTRHIRQWPIIEGSLTHTPADWRSVVGQTGTRISTLKALTSAIENEPSATEPKPAATVGSAKESGAPTQSHSQADGDERTAFTRAGIEQDELSNNVGEKQDMTPEQVRELCLQLLQELGITAPMQPAEQAAVEDAMMTATRAEGAAEPLPEDEMMKSAVMAGIKAINELTEKRKAAQSNVIKGLVNEARNAPGISQTAAVGRGGNGNGRIEVGENLKYAHLSASDMACGLLALQASPQLKRLNLPMTAYVSEDYVKHMVGKAQDFMAQKGFPGLRPEDQHYIKSVMPRVKANELDASNIATQGQEWVGDFWSSSIIERARSNRVYKEVLSRGVMEETIGEGSDTAYFPIEGNDPVAYVRNQANSVDSTGRPQVTVNINPFITGNVSVTPNELALASSYTTILKEDSVIPIARQLNYQMGEKADETVEQALINGDTTTTASTNINIIDGTPGTGLQKPYYLLTDGWIKSALVTYAATQARSGGSLDENDFRLTVKLLDRAIRPKKDKLLFLVDSDTYNTALDIVAIKTDDVRVRNSTLTSGSVEDIYGYRVVESGFMELANSAGKVPVAGGTLGRMLLIYPPYWGIAWKRRLTIEEAYDPLSGTFVYVASFRMGMVARGANAAAITYNLTIA